MIPPPKEHVVGLIALPIPTPEGELGRFVQKYAHALGESGGERILWRPIGDPRQTDKRYRRQRTSEMSDSDKASAREFQSKIAKMGSRAHYVRGEYQRVMESFGIRLNELPVVVFIAPEPVDAWAMLHLPLGLFEDQRTRKALAELLISRLSEEEVFRHSVRGAFTKSCMGRLRKYLVAVEAETTKLSAAVILNGASGCDRRKSVAPKCARRRAHDDSYALVHCSREASEEIDKAAYGRLVRNKDKYEFIIDGIARKCFKRKSRSGPHRESKLTVAEFEIIHAFITKGGIQRPVKMRPGRSGDSMSAIRLFYQARSKVDLKQDNGEYFLFRGHKDSAADRRRFEFQPAKTVRWLLIEPISE